MVKNILAGIFCIFIFQKAAWSQQSDEPGNANDSSAIAEDLLQMGLEVFDYEHRKQARELFELAISYDPDNAMAQLMTGKSIMLTVHKEEALPHFLTAYHLDKNIDEEIHYLLGQGFHYSEDFVEAINYYIRYRQKLAHSMDFEKSRKIFEVDRKIFECRNGLIYKAYPADVDITNLGEAINTEFPEYAPIISADESVLIFTSRRDDNINQNLAPDFEYYEDIFISYNENGEFQEAENMGQPVNTPFHNANVGLSPDGSKLFIYRDINGGDIYESYRKEDGSWTPPDALEGQVNSEWHENSATVTSGGDVLFFTSNRPGGVGGMDIYRAEENKKGEWINARNLGPVINTQFDEEAVFISDDGKYLYFSSFGHYGMGDLDIYRAEWDEDTQSWKEPLNMGYPINSVENDIYFVLSEDGNSGYFSSVKFQSRGEQDIYHVDLEGYEPKDLRYLMQQIHSDDWLKPKVKLNLYLKDSLGNSPESSEVVLFGSDGTKRTGKQISDGAYHFEFPVSLDSVEMDLTVRYKSGIYPADPVITATTEEEEATASKPDSIVFSPSRELVYQNVFNVYYYFDSRHPISYNDLEYLLIRLKENPGLMVEVSGHTDSVGPDEYNQRLSEWRAGMVKNYLVENGIDDDRIITVGYGPDRPLGDNSTLAGRRLNRRAELRLFRKQKAE